MRFSPHSSPVPLVFGDKFDPYILTESPERGQTNVGWEKQFSSFMRQYLENGRRLRPKLLLMTNRNLHMDFRLVPMSMTLDDLEWLQVRIFSELCVVEL